MNALYQGQAAAAGSPLGNKGGVAGGRMPGSRGDAPRADPPPTSDSVREGMNQFGWPDTIGCARGASLVKQEWCMCCREVEPRRERKERAQGARTEKGVRVEQERAREWRVQKRNQLEACGALDGCMRWKLADVHAHRL